MPRISLRCLAAVMLISSHAATAVAASPVQEWPSYNRDLGSQRHSPLTQINPANVKGLHQLCSYDVGQISGFQTGPLMVDGTLFATTREDIFSIDPNTCKEHWRQHEALQTNGPSNAVPANANRGLAFMDGRLFRGMLDGRVLAYDAKTGRRVWTTTISDGSKAEIVTAAPIAWHGLVFIGNAGSDNKGVKGHMFALDAGDDHIVWETFLVPRSPGDVVRGPVAPDPNAQQLAFSWRNAPDFPITGGGTWTSYTLDTEHGLLYIPGGNPAPDYYTASRQGDNLYTDSVVVLDVKTGAYRQHFQLVPNDYHDYDVASAPMLIKSAKSRSILVDTPKDGHLYGIDLSSRQRIYRQPLTTILNPDQPLSMMAPGTRFCPGAAGGSEWNGPSFDAASNLIFSGQVDWCNTVVVTSADVEKLRSTLLGAAWGGDFDHGGFGVSDPTWGGWLKAADADTGKVIWQFKAPAPVISGVTSTASGLLFFGDANGNFYAFDAAHGRRLWSQNLHGAVGGGVITYDTGAGQRVAVAAGLTSSFWPLAPDSRAKIVVYGL